MKISQKLKLMPCYLLIIFLPACPFSCNKKTANKDSKEDALAKVNGISLSKETLNSAYDKVTKRLNPDDLNQEAINKVKSDLLNKMIDDEVVSQEAEKSGIQVDRFERIELLETWKNRIGGEKAYQAFLERSNMSENELLNSLVLELKKGKLLEKIDGPTKISEEEITAHFAVNKQMYGTPEMVQASHILFKFAKEDPNAKEAAVLKKAQNVLAEALKPGADFSKLAEKYSECPSAKKGGDLGLFPKGRMVKDFEEAAFSAPLNKVIGPIKTSFGYHLIKVSKKTEGKSANLEDAKPKIEEYLKKDKQIKDISEMIKNLRKKSDIWINEPLLSAKL